MQVCSDQIDSNFSKWQASRRVNNKNEKGQRNPEKERSKQRDGPAGVGKKHSLDHGFLF